MRVKKRRNKLVTLSERQQLLNDEIKDAANRLEKVLAEIANEFSSETYFLLDEIKIKQTVIKEFGYRSFSTNIKTYWKCS